MKSNKVKTMNSSFQNEHVIYNGMDFKTDTKADASYFCRSHASKFANSGISQGGQHYSRDPLTGTWFKNIDDRRRELHDSHSDISFRYTESNQEKGDQAKTYTIWAAPCAGQFWREPMSKPQKPTNFGFTHGPVQRTIPTDPKDMPSPLSPLCRTTSAPNFLPQSQSRRVMAQSQKTLARTGSASLSSTM